MGLIGERSSEVIRCPRVGWHIGICGVCVVGNGLCQAREGAMTTDVLELPHLRNGWVDGWA